jgi:hypothetical protein
MGDPERALTISQTVPDVIVVGIDDELYVVVVAPTDMLSILAAAVSDCSLLGGSRQKYSRLYPGAVVKAGSILTLSPKNVKPDRSPDP